VTARAAVAAALVALALPAGVAAAAAGDRDGGFGTGGEAIVPLGPGARAAAIALAPDGRLVIAGDGRGAGGEKVLTARFDAAGALDRSFATTGARLDQLGSGEPTQRAGAVLAQADGGTLVAAAAGDQFALARFGPDGLADGLFGAGGVALRTPAGDGGGLPAGTGPAAIAAMPTGQIVVAGSAGVATDDDVPGERIVVARYSDRGVPDPGFGHDGFTLLQLGAASPRAHAASAARALVVLPDGRILIAGRATDRAGAQRVFVARLTAAGALDTTFARGGRLLAQLGRASALRAAGSRLDALALRPDGTLLAAGSATDVAGNDAVLLARFTAAGALDARFGRGGTVLSQLAAPAGGVVPRSAARALVLAPDGSALVAGAATGGALAARYGASTGRLDCGFGIAGRTVAFGGAGFDPATDGAAAALLTPAGGLVLAGRRAGGGVLLGRLLTAPLAAAPVRPSVLTLAPHYGGKGRGYGYGLVDGRCRALTVRFEVSAPGRRTVRTVVQRVAASPGPQVVCAPLRGLRPGVRYFVRVVAPAGAGAGGGRRALRAVARGARLLPQEGCG
jgi:uncharacterized delta-60 repeat protein